MSKTALGVAVAAWLVVSGGANARAEETCQMHAMDYDLTKLVQLMKHPRQDFVILTPHRGLIQFSPENTIAAVSNAVEAGFETVEIDLRLNRDHTLWLMHDAVADRLTTAVGHFSAYRDVTLEAGTAGAPLVRVKDRLGQPTSSGVTSFKQIMDYQAEKMRGPTRGFMLVVDIKSPVPGDPFLVDLGVMAAFGRAVEMAAGKNLLSAVVFKMKGREITSNTREFESILARYPNTPVMVVPVLHADDEQAGNAIIGRYLTPAWERNFVGFETVVENDGQSIALGWWRKLRDAGRTVPTFLSWNEFPEGVARSDATCCHYRQVRPDPRGALDFTGTTSWQVHLDGRWVTSDAAGFLHDFYCARGERNMAAIRPSSQSR